MNYPDDLLYTKEHEWVRIEGELVTVGITHFAQNLLGDIVFVDIDTVGRILNTGDVFGTVEAVKTVSDLFTPLSGVVIELNPLLEKHPELLNTDTYDNGWIIKLRILNGNEIGSLLSSQEYQQIIF